MARPWIFKTFLATVLFQFSFLAVFGQDKNVKGTITTKDTADLSILHVYPDSFPNVEVVFKAEKRNGDPVWSLGVEDMMVYENSASCDVVSLNLLSEQQAINIGLVIDQSGSMASDKSLLYDSTGNPTFKYDYYGNLITPAGYVSPLDNAKKAVASFIQSFDSKKGLYRHHRVCFIHHGQCFNDTKPK